MSLLLAAALALAVTGRQATPAQAWTWTLYEGEGPVVLANEVPDTASLRATLQCDPRSSVVEITVYGEGAASAAPQTGFARLTSGGATAASEARLGRGGRLTVTLRTDHPLFATFVGSGDMAVVAGDRSDAIKVERPHLAKLRRFADRCAG